MRSEHISVTIDLERVRANAERVRQRCGVALIAVVKADAYGLGAVQVVAALDSVADGFACFSLEEARALKRPCLVLGPALGDPAEYRALGATPTIATPAEAERFAGGSVAINVDTGMQRFGCAPAALDAICEIAHPTDIFTHAVDESSASLLYEVGQGRKARLHAAATSLLDCAGARLDAVRPGLALYRGAVRVTARLHMPRDCTGPIGYTHFRRRRVGILLAGYSHGITRGPLRINGRVQEIVEVGMNTSFVTVDEADREGDEIVLLSDELNEAELARHAGTREHAILCRLASCGLRTYRGERVSPPPRDTTRSSASSPPRT